MRNKEIEEIKIREVEENIKLLEDKYLDTILGSLIGGAAGDALGYAVEFLSEEEIFKFFGPNGITEYILDEKTGKALISDDTQMTLYTANGIMIGDTRLNLRGIGGVPHHYIYYTYRDWLKTQIEGFEEMGGYGVRSWLNEVPELYSRRAPGNSCLSALVKEVDVENGEPVNDSKGCGAIMRIAPLALYYKGRVSSEVLMQEAVYISKITHGHPLGYLPSAFVTDMLNQIIVDGNKKDLKEIVINSINNIKKVFKDEKYLNVMIDIVNKAIALSENDKSDLENIHEIGEGWVAEETLGIALYCCLRHKNDFSNAIIAAVNHRGDSDSTGAVAGNILGAYLGYNSIDLKWKENLELKEVITEIAYDVCHGCQISEFGAYWDEIWEEKYCYGNRVGQ